MSFPFEPARMPAWVKNCDNLIKWFSRFRRNDFINRSSLQYIEDILQRLGSPHKNMGKVIHVTGTNGKGSVTWKVARCLEAQGFKVGLYVSPHIRRFTERITVGGQEISDEDMKQLANKVFKVLGPDDHLGMVGMMVCIAFLYFQEQNLDYCVVEAGIGAMLDHTNVVDPIVSAITSVGEDHLNIIGPNLEDVAFNKSFIFKPGRDAVVGAQVMTKRSVAMVINRAINERNVSTFTIANEGKNYELENQQTAIEILRKALNDPNFQPNQQALKSSPPGRYHKILLGGRLNGISFRRLFGKFITFDVGHNVPAMRALCWRITAPSILILALSKKKNLDGCCDIVLRCRNIKRIFLLDIDDLELHHPRDVAKRLRKEEPRRISYLPGNITEKLTEIGKWAFKKSLETFITGSFITVDAISSALGIDLPNIANTQLDSPVKQLRSSPMQLDLSSSRELFPINRLPTPPRFEGEEMEID